MGSAFLCTARRPPSTGRSKGAQLSNHPNNQIIPNMKIIPNSHINLNEAVAISSGLSSRQLTRIGLDRYALILLDRSTPIFGFHSHKFSNLLNSLDSSIVDIDLLMSCPRSAKNIAPHIEIRLTLSTGEIYTFNGNDEVFSCTKTTPAKSTGPDRSLATQIWNLPETHPYDHMLISNKLARNLKPFIQQSSASQVLKNLWRSYFYLRDHPCICSGDEIHICGEYGHICTREHNCGRVSFHSLSESSSMNPNK